MIIADIISSVVLILLSIYIYISSLSFPKGKSQLTGPAFYPQVVAIILMVTSVFIIIRAVKRLKENNGDIPLPRINNWKRVIVVMFSTFIYVVVLKRLGFIITTFVYLATLILVMQPEKDKIKRSVLISAIMTGFVYFFFAVLFSASLPRGILF